MHWEKNQQKTRVLSLKLMRSFDFKVSNFFKRTIWSYLPMPGDFN